MSEIIFRSPSKYIQGKGALNNIGEHVKSIGSKPLIMSDDVVWGITEETISKSLKDENISFHFESFHGEASINEVNRISDQGKEHSVDMVIGVGGGKTIAQACEKTLFSYGQAAYKAVQKGIVTKHVEAVVEANTLLSGLGFESGGLAGAHAIHNGFTVLEGKIHELTHGEKMAYGTLVHLLLELHSEEELQKYISFYKSLGLPTTLKEMHLEDASYEDLLSVGKAAKQEGETMTNLSVSITADDIAQAILAVDAVSQ